MSRRIKILLELRTRGTEHPIIRILAPRDRPAGATVRIDIRCEPTLRINDPDPHIAGGITGGRPTEALQVVAGQIRPEHVVERSQARGYRRLGEHAGHGVHVPHLCGGGIRRRGGRQHQEPAPERVD